MRMQDELGVLCGALYSGLRAPSSLLSADGMRDAQLRAAGMSHRIGYLSGAPRVSTADTAVHGGSRAHVVGVIGAFERRGWGVEKFIAGDRLGAGAIGLSNAFVRPNSIARRVVGDLGKIALGRMNARRALGELAGHVDWVYERFAAFHSLGVAFQRYGIPWILETQGPMFYEARIERRVVALWRLARALELAAYRRCDVLICVSDALGALLSERYAVDARKIVVVPNGVDPCFFNPVTAAPERQFPFFTIGYVGSLDAWQALDCLIDAVAEVRHAQRIEIGVVVVGSGIMREAWIERANRAGIGLYIKFLGQQPRSAIPALLRGFDVGFSGQRMMSIGSMYHSPLKLLEYLAMGVPVIASEFADSRRLVRDRENGFLFSHDRPVSLTEAIRAALARCSDLPAMGHAGRAFVLRDHSWDARVAFMVDRIQSLIPPARRAVEA
jgi:glycosyltransferase involved in cell wall biosynthesis